METNYRSIAENVYVLSSAAKRLVLPPGTNAVVKAGVDAPSVMYLVFVDGSELALQSVTFADAEATRAGAADFAVPSVPSFQDRAGLWADACFGNEIAMNAAERNQRFVEESLELAQACGFTRAEVDILADYVFSRSIGEKAQEVGGVMTTLATLCRAQGINMLQAGEKELAHNWTRVDAIRAKRATKPPNSPLPAAA